MASVQLKDRTHETVKIWYIKSRSPYIRRTLPVKDQSMEEALEDYERTLEPGSSSFGKTVWADGEYAGDIWCYGLHSGEEPDAMISYCIFDSSRWSQGIATQALALFLDEVRKRFDVRTVGAFTYSDNTASVRVLEKNGFEFIDEFFEDGRMSRYYLRNLM